MIRRSAAVSALLVLSACDQAAAPAVDEGRLIECALAGAGSFARECRADVVRQGDVPQLILRHPDGGFRRFEILAGDAATERHLATADGADPAQFNDDGQVLAITIEADRYRVPRDVYGHGDI